MVKLTESQRQFIKELQLKYESDSFIQSFRNKDSCLLFCDMPQKYTLIYGDYHIPHDFKLTFETNEKLLRFGLLHEGTSEFEMKQKKISHFFPSAFISIENKLSGAQNMKTGHHYQGIEFFIHTSYIESLCHIYPELESLSKLPDNHAILFLPTRITQIFNCLECQILNKKITPLLLEAKVLECLSLIAQELNTLNDEEFLDMLELKTLVSSNEVQLTTQEIHAIQKAHDILTSHLDHPPSLKQLSDDLLISEQKLSLGFKDLFHTTIGQFIKDQRMHEAANLLTTTEHSIDEISNMVGYSHPSNFGKAFKAKYLRTPLQYRKFNQR